MQLGLVGQQLVGTADRPYVVKQAVFRQRWPTMDGGKAARSAPAQQKKTRQKEGKSKKQSVQTQNLERAKRRNVI